MYRSVHDPIVALAHVAGVTERTRLGVGVVDMPYYSPIVLAKQLTTLDAVSNGRLDVGLGSGWAPEEFAAAGASMERRGRRADEFLRCLTAIWDDDPVAFEGEFYRVPLSTVHPRPVQQPHPPLLLGGSADAALRRAGRHTDGWISSSRHDLRSIGGAVEVIRDAARQAGRDAAVLRFIVRGAASLGHELQARDGMRRPLTGSADQIRDDLAALADHGITEVFLDPNFDPRVVAPGVDAADAERLAMELLDAFAPNAF
jgi:probable F420-dependent oxidoreductase